MVPIYSVLLFGGQLTVLHDRGLLKVPSNSTDPGDQIRLYLLLNPVRFTGSLTAAGHHAQPGRTLQWSFSSCGNSYRADNWAGGRAPPALRRRRTSRSRASQCCLRRRSMCSSSCCARRRPLRRSGCAAGGRLGGVQGAGAHRGAGARATGWRGGAAGAKDRGPGRGRGPGAHH